MKRYILAALATAALASASAQTYQVVVTSTDGEKTVFNTSDLSQVRFTQTPKYISADHYYGGTYNPGIENASYSFTIATSQPDAQGDPMNVGDFQLTLCLYGPLSAEAHNAAIPDGYYRYAPGSTADWGIDPNKSGMWLRIEAGDDGISPEFMINGTVDVRQDGKNTDLRAELDFIDGTHADVSYYGPMEFAVGAGGSTEFDTDLNIDFTNASGRAWCNWFYPLADDAAVYLFTGSFNEQGVQTEGFYLNLDMNIPKDDSHTSTWTPVMPDGVYTVDYREAVASYTYRPYTLNQGREVDVFGAPAYVGTYLTHLAQDGRLTAGLVKKGTLTISENGSKYAVDMELENGVKIQGEYGKRPNIANFIDNSSKPPIHEIDRDVELNFIPATVAINYDLGNYIVEDLRSHILMLTDPAQKAGDYLSFELFNTSFELEDGTYTVNETLAPNSCIPGTVDYAGQMLFSWYGDLAQVDDEGYNTFLSPIVGGTFTISTLENGNRKFDFDLIANEGKHVTGTWSGKVVNVAEDDMQNKARAKTPKAVKRTWGTSLRDRQAADCRVK